MWRQYWAVPYVDMEDPDTPGPRVFMIEGNGGYVLKDQSNPDLWRIQVHLTEAQHEVFIAHPDVTWIEDWVFPVE